MKPYPKIQSIYKRDSTGEFVNEFSRPEFEYLQYNKWLFTEKVDGMNIRVIYDGTDVKFAGKTDRAQIPLHLLMYLQEKFTVGLLGNIFQQLTAPICLYGEGYGEKIQSGGKYLKNKAEFVLFDILIDGWWLKRDSISYIANELDIMEVPDLNTGTLADAEEMARKGFKSKWGDFIAEGLVLRPITELFGRGKQRVITKVKHKDYINV